MKNSDADLALTTQVTPIARVLRCAWITAFCIGMALTVMSGLDAARVTKRDSQLSSAAPESWIGAKRVLESSCLSCHDSRRSKGGLDLSTREGFLAGGEIGPIFRMEDGAESRMAKAIRHESPDLEMPPRGKLPPEEIAHLEAWLTAGAPWPEGATLASSDASHAPTKITLEAGRRLWAYRPLSRPEVPDTAMEHPIDAFVDVRLASAGLKMNPPADRRTRLRRLTYGLTGLPPTLEDVEEFETATAPDAWQHQIDRWLDSPEYGEHWARHWLDLVRFAETNGYERDTTKLNMWRYRDYLIRSFNDDKPYDEFVIEQLAGDEWNAVRGIEDPDALLATGYHRLMIWDDEPADPAQARADVIADVVDTTGVVFMGTTVGCARCHDHKKDPISQRDYYSMFAFFNNLTDHGIGKAITRPVPDPRRPESKATWTSLDRDRHLAELDGQLDEVLAELRSVWATRFPPDAAPVTLVSDSRKKPRSWSYSTTETQDWAAAGFDDSGWTIGQGGFGREGTPGAVIGTPWTTSDIYLRARFLLTEIPAALTLTFHHDEDFEVFLNGLPVFSRPGYRSDYETIQLPESARQALVVGSNVVAVHCHQSGGGQFLDIGLATGLLPGRERPVWIERLKQHGAKLLAPTVQRRGEELLVQIGNARTRPVREAYPAPIAFEKGPQAPEQRIHLRGSVQAPGDRVEPAFPSVMVPEGSPVAARIEPIPGEQSSGRRLSFARWLTRPEHPLTAKVMVNRVWQFHFGRGFVGSSSDFGGLGSGVTHPELLDYLASEFVRHDWSLKWLHRFILSSRTYQMSSMAQSQPLAQDPLNHLLWRFDMRRLRAEEIRDSILTANGTLNRQSFGPSFFSKLPPEVLATASRPDHAWGKSTEEDQNRRSVYIFAKRSLRDPFLEAFDQADTDMSCSVRLVTNVPTQTLTLLNSDFLAEESQLFAKRLTIREADRREWRAVVDRAIGFALQRRATPSEVREYSAFLDRMIDTHGLSADDAMRAFALLIYNLNEFLFLD